ncbi:MAG: hypothetical protein ACHQ4G_09850 [Opitutales bacterium]
MNVPLHLSSLRRASVRGLAVLALLGASASARAYTKDALNINVQSSVEEPVGKGSPPQAAAHGKVYFLAPPLEERSTLKLIKPVDPKLMETEVRKVLQARGFRPAVKGDTPDMTITVLYGRGWVHNPYASPDEVSDNSVPGAWTTREVAKLDASGAYVPFSSILEDKRTNANQEKLVIIVTAWTWDVPAMKKHKAKRLWRTMVYLDDPDHRDLNQVTPQLLAVAADYFDRETKGPEDELTKPLPEGHVDIGTPRVTEQPARISK